jgi:hypothetical protein
MAKAKTLKEKIIKNALIPGLIGISFGITYASISNTMKDRTTKRETEAAKVCMSKIDEIEVSDQDFENIFSNFTEENRETILNDVSGTNNALLKRAVQIYPEYADDISEYYNW